METIESVIFDWGGVLIDDPRPGLLRYCADAFGVSQQRYTPVHDSFLDDFQKGLIDEAEFWRRISRELGKSAPGVASLWSGAFRSACKPRPEVFRLVSSLHAKGYKTALLSNTELPAVELFREFGYDMFDALVFSCEQGTAKPERRIYEVTLEKLGSPARRSVFIDDRLDYIEGARAVGINTILFTGIEQLKRDLTGLGVK
ncbi:MAG TPA: HAD family phosphatase [Sedimentisphaerales bacterium]|nr:HAD family phosphatase [Sedimentisphaerales bacterium]